MAQSAGAVEYTDCISAEGFSQNECPGYNTKQWWDSSNAGVLRNAKYYFIAIALRSTLAQSGSTW